MRFTVFKTSGYMYVETSSLWYSKETIDKFKNTPPCKRAVLIEEDVQVTTKIRDENGRLIDFITGKTGHKYHWEIDLNTIEDLMKFLSEAEHEAIFSDDGTIEIYDTYRE